MEVRNDCAVEERNDEPPKEASDSVDEACEDATELRPRVSVSCYVLDGYHGAPTYGCPLPAGTFAESSRDDAWPARPRCGASNPLGCRDPPWLAMAAVLKLSVVVVDWRGGTAHSSLGVPGRATKRTGGDCRATATATKGEQDEQARDRRSVQRPKGGLFARCDGAYGVGYTGYKG